MRSLMRGPRLFAVLLLTFTSQGAAAVDFKCSMTPLVGPAEAFPCRTIADSATDVPPDEDEAFTHFFPPPLDGHNVGVRARSASTFGVYKSLDGDLSRVADITFPVPNTDPVRFFENFSRRISISDDTVAFIGGPGVAQFGVYTGNSAGLEVVADAFTPIPSGFGTFIGFESAPSLHDGMTAFIGQNVDETVKPFGQIGVYKSNTDGTLVALANEETLMPSTDPDCDGTIAFGCPGTFCQATVAFRDPSIEGDKVAFVGAGGDMGLIELGGIYLWMDGELGVVVDTKVSPKGGGPPFAGFSSPSLDGQNLAFFGVAGRLGGIYTAVHQAMGVYEIALVAGTETPIPEGVGDFRNVSNPSMDEGAVAFFGRAVSQQGIYTNRFGSLSKVIDLNDTINGIAIEGLQFSVEGLSGDKLAFAADLEDGSAGVFVLSLAENAPPVADAGVDQTAECTSPAGALVTLDGSESKDPDGDALSYKWRNGFGKAYGVSPTVQLPIGVHPITLVVNDGELDSEPDQVLVTVADTTPPGIVASLTTVSGERLRVGFAVSDLCDPEPLVTAVLKVPGVTDIPVLNGQIIVFEVDDESEVESEDGVLEIEAANLTLRVTATDASGNAAAVAVQPGGGA